MAITATEHICRKDFGMDPNGQNLRRSSHQMMRAMTAAMAAITCREPLTTTMILMIKQALHNTLGNIPPGSDQSKMVDKAAIAVTEANIILATNFIVKSACEKAVFDIEKRLEQDLNARKQALKEANPFQCDAELISISDKIPEKIRLQQGAITESQMKIYDDFSAYFSLFC